LLVSDLLDFRYYGQYCCTVNFGGNTFLSFRGNSFFEKSRGIPFFLQKEGEVYKEGGDAPPSEEKGGSHQFFEGLPPNF